MPFFYPGTLADDTWLTHGPGSQMLKGLLDWLNNVPLHPKDAHVLIPGTCEYVIFHGKLNFAAVIKLKVWRWGDYLELS